jgi:hypothetical protein
MKYLLQIYGNDTREEFEARSDEEKQELYAAWGALNQTPGVTPGAEMDAPATATTVRVKDGETLITDGPFIDVKEALGGTFVYEADDLDAAIALAARVPTARLGGAIEIRPLVQR